MDKKDPYVNTAKSVAPVLVISASTAANWLLAVNTTFNSESRFWISTGDAAARVAKRKRPKETSMLATEDDGGFSTMGRRSAGVLFSYESLLGDKILLVRKSSVLYTNSY